MTSPSGYGRRSRGISDTTVISVTTPPKYDPTLVERAALDEVVELHPTRLTIDELCLRIVGDPHDDAEVEIAKEAARSLRASGLIRYRNDEQVVEATQVALRAHELMASS
jgi:hypothetical protein